MPRAHDQALTRAGGAHSKDRRDGAWRVNACLQFKMYQFQF